jgi:hypothetical protein
VSIDVSKLNPGDIVHVKGTVVDFFRDPARPQVRVEMERGHQTWVSPDAVVHHEKRPPRSGDAVRWRTGQSLGKVLAIDEGMAWVRTNAGMRSTIPLNELEVE